MSTQEHEAPSQKDPVMIVSDSTCSLSPELARHYGVQLVPTYITFGGRTYRDGVDLDATQFYALLRSSAQLPTTAQPTVADFTKVYTELWEQVRTLPGAAIVSVHPSSKMTKTVDAAQAASRELPEIPVHVIDTGTISMGLGMVAIAAARAAAAGQDAATVVRLTEDVARRVRVVFTVETMEYLRKGGRIGAATALLGMLLNIKPVLYLGDGQVQPLEKPRTRKKAIAVMLDWVAAQVASSQALHAAVLHCDAADDAQALTQEIVTRFLGVDLVMTAEAGPTIGTHGGPGTIGVVFYTEESGKPGNA